MPLLRFLIGSNPESDSSAANSNSSPWDDRAHPERSPDWRRMPSPVIGPFTLFGQIQTHSPADVNCNGGPARRDHLPDKVWS